MKTKDLKFGYHMYGNKGACWSDKIHIAQSGLFAGTLCGTPMLANNWARIWKKEECNCPECLIEYKKLTCEHKSQTMLDAGGDAESGPITTSKCNDCGEVITQFGM